MTFYDRKNNGAPVQLDMFPIDYSEALRNSSPELQCLRTQAETIRKLLPQPRKHREIGLLLKELKRILRKEFETFLANELPEIGGAKEAEQFIAAAESPARPSRSKPAKRQTVGT